MEGLKVISNDKLMGCAIAKGMKNEKWRDQQITQFSSGPSSPSGPSGPSKSTDPNESVKLLDKIA